MRLAWVGPVLVLGLSFETGVSDPLRMNLLTEPLTRQLSAEPVQSRFFIGTRSDA